LIWFFSVVELLVSGWICSMVQPVFGPALFLPTYFVDFFNRGSCVLFTPSVR
jgi:hypothetical protein